MPGALEQSGSRAIKDVRWAPLFLEDLWPGLYTNRSALHDPSGLYERKYMGGRPGSIIGGINTEVSVNNTVIRRYGLSAFSSVTYPTPPLSADSFELTDGTIQVIVDTGSTGSLVLTSVAASSGGSAVYTGTITGGGSNAYAGLIFTVSGFSNTVNNGTFTCTASSTTTLTLTTSTAVAESHAAAVVSTGAVYVDNQNGSKTFLFAKGAGAGQTKFISVAGILYMGDGVETRKYTPGNPNGTIWNWGIVAPTAQPTVTIVESGAAAVLWQANTVWSTMGLIYDSGTNTTQQLISVNASGTNTTQFGTTGNGQPAWNQTPGGTTTDNTVTWTNRGPIVLWTGNTLYNNASVGGTTTNPCIIYDPGTKSCYINANPGLSSGTSGPSYPNFKAGAGQATHDGGVKWFYIGTPGIPGTWQSAHVYPALGTVTNNDAGSSITEPVGLTAGLPTNQVVYWQTSSGGTSGASGIAPKWNTAVGQQTGGDGDNVWLALGSDAWAATTGVTAWHGSGSTFSAIRDANGNFQVCITGGTTATIVPGKTYTLTAAGTASGGNTSYTGTFSPVIPVGTPVTITGFVAHTSNNGTFIVVSCSATTLVLTNASGIAETHAGVATYNAWGTTYGDPTSDGTAVWTCVGTAMQWAASTIWFLPTPGFSPPTSASPYGGASVIDANNFVEFVINSGKGGGSTPSWGALNTNTTDGAATWYNLEPFAQQSLVTTKSHVYTYSFKARSLTDFYSVVDPTTNQLPVPPGSSNALPPPTGSEANTVSSASPANFTLNAPNSGSVNTITGVGSLDPQVDTIIIWRDADGGGVDNMFELTEIPAPPPIGGVAQPWTFKDFLPDTPTGDFPGLDELVPAPIDGVNDPPPASAQPQAYNFQRIWVATGSEVFFSGGPDTLVGNPNEAFNAADEFPFLSTVVRAVPSTQGLITYTQNSIEMIQGGPSTASFFSITLARGVGLGNYNALDVFAGEQFFMDTTGQLRILSPTLSLTSAGMPITDQLTKFNPATAYVAFHEQPNDSAIYIGTGSSTYNGSTGWFRMNPRQVPGGPNGPEPVWSPFAAISGGCRMLQSVEVSPGQKRLLVGALTGNTQILERDRTVFTDNGTQYASNFQIGSIFLAHRGELALLKFIEADFVLATTAPTMSFLLNEISGSYTNFTSGIFDPPSVYGATTGPASYNPLRFYFSQTQSIARVIHMQIGVDFGTANRADEIFNLTIYGAVAKGM